MSGAIVLQIAWRITLKLAWPAVARLAADPVRARDRIVRGAGAARAAGRHPGLSPRRSTRRSIAIRARSGSPSAYAVTLLLHHLARHLLRSRGSPSQGARYSTVTGKGFRPRTIDLGRWRYLTAAIFILYFCRHRAAAVPGAAVVVAAEVLQRAVAGGAQHADARLLPRRPRLSAASRARCGTACCWRSAAPP